MGSPRSPTRVRYSRFVQVSAAGPRWIDDPAPAKEGALTRADVLATRRLVLRDLTPADARAVFAIRSDPSVAENTAWFPHRDLGESQGYIDRTLSGPLERDHRFRRVWAICLDGDATVVGTIDFIRHSDTAGHIHFALGSRYWGRGLAPEAVSAVTAWAFAEFPRVTEVLAGVLTRNHRAARVLEKAGFVRGETRVATRPPKYPDDELPATTYHLARPAEAEA